MKIDTSKVQLQASSLHREESFKEEHLRTWVDQPQQIPMGDVIQISAQGLEAQKTESIKPKEEELMSDEDHLKLKLLEAMLSKLTGKKFKFRFVAIDLMSRDERSQVQLDLSKVRGPSGGTDRPVEREGWGLHYSYQESYTETQTMDFSAEGKVTLKDGRQVEFSVDLHMSRTYSQSFALDIKAGDALKDPLVLDIEGKGLVLSDKTMKFDLDFDGNMDEIPVLAKGSGYLVIDRNNNNILDNGSELFGPKTDHGFAELAEHDGDMNGWIDETDPIFKDLKIWMSDGEGQGRLIGLVEAGVGAIYLGMANSAFAYKDGQNGLMGMLKQTGVYLKENGKPGTIHELDLKI